MQGDESGTSTPAATTEPTTAAAATITPDDLDFSDIKKKKKSTKKKAAFDLEAFEKELNDSKSKSKSTTTTTSSSGGGGAAEEDDDDGPEPDTTHLDHVDEAELGDDPFAQHGDAPVGVDAGNEAWLKSDRDYTYPEVRLLFLLLAILNWLTDVMIRSS